MKINEVVVEGVMDWAKGIAAKVKGDPQAKQVAQAQKAAGQKIDRVTKEVFSLWNQELANHPGLNPAQQAQLLVNWTNDQFHDKPGSKIPAPTALDNKSVYDYLTKRTQEYFQSAQVDVKPASQLAKDYAYPTVDADLEIRGYIYVFDARVKKWYEENSGKEITNPRDIQTLNKRYYDIKTAYRGGAVTDPDIPNAREPELDFTKPTAPEPQVNPTRGVINPDGSITVAGPKGKAPSKVMPTDPMYKSLRASLEKTAASTSPNVKQGPWDPFGPVRDLSEGRMIREGGNAIPSSTPVKKNDVRTVVGLAKSFLPQELHKGLQTDIGSAGYKIESGDIDVMVEAEDVVNLFKTQEAKDPVKEAKQKLKAYFEGKGIEANVNGRNVSIGVVYTDSETNQKRVAQVDVMVIHEAGLVAPWHQHGARGMYDDPEFKGSELFMLISSIAKHLGLKFDAFGAKLLRRDDNEVVARTRKQVAKVLLGPRAKETDLNSVKTMLKALENDPDREGKLAQARQDAAKGLMRLPEAAPAGTAEWFRQMSEVVK